MEAKATSEAAAASVAPEDDGCLQPDWRRCTGTNQGGRRCSLPRTPGDTTCRWHGALPERVVLVHWYDHDCLWLTKFCDEEHRRQAWLPVDVLRQYATQARVRSKGPYPPPTDSDDPRGER